MPNTSCAAAAIDASVSHKTSAADARLSEAPSRNPSLAQRRLNAGNIGVAAVFRRKLVDGARRRSGVAGPQSLDYRVLQHYIAAMLEDIELDAAA